MATSARNDAPVVPMADVPADTLTKLYLSALDRFGSHDAMMFEAADGWRGIGYEEVERRVERLAAGLQALGIERGDRVGILSENRPEWAVADFAVLALGAADVPVYATLPPNQTHYILEDSGTRLLFVSDAEQLAKVREVRSRLPALETIVAFDPSDDMSDVLALDDVLTMGQERIASGDFPGARSLSDAIEPGDLATLIYTSGTTGDPKGVRLTHYNMASNVAAVDQHGVFTARPGTVALSFLPLSHSFERVVDYYFWHVGATIAYVDDPKKIADALVAVRPHVAAAAPRVFEKIYARVMGAAGISRLLIEWARRVAEASVDERIAGRRSGPVGWKEKLADRLVFSKLRARTGGRIQAFASGSAPLSAEIARFFWAAGLPIFEGYGLTETSPILTANRPGQAKLGTVGHPIPGTEIRIGPDGEILARGPQVMDGYWENPEATDEVIDADGWFHSGDIGEIDQDGFLRITDRIKNIIVTAGGKNIAPAAIENAAALSPYVAQVVMIGDQRPFPSLLVVPEYEHLATWARQQGIDSVDPGTLAADPRVHDFLVQETLGRLTGFARFETPKKIAVLPRELTIDSGELTPSLKVKREEVQRNYRDLVEGIYAGH